MNIFRLVIKSIRFYWKQNLALLAGTIISTAVLTGALIIGDSVRSSMIQLVNFRLGETRFALLTGDRFVRMELASEIGEDLDIHTAPLLQINGIAINPLAQRRSNDVQIFGVDEDFWQIGHISPFFLDEQEAIINTYLASKLNLNIGDEILLRIEKPSVIPLNAPFVSESDQSKAIRLQIKDIVDHTRLGRFSLKSNQSAPSNVFVSLPYITRELDLDTLSNIILVAQKEDQSLTAKDLDNSLSENMKLMDVGLKIQDLPEYEKLEVVSNRIFMDAPLVQVIHSLPYKQDQVLTYLVNTLSLKQRETPYSFVSALDYANTEGVLQDGEVIINQWLSEDLNAQAGDTIEMKYYTVGPLRNLKETYSQCKVIDIIAQQNALFNTSLMPAFPGLADAGSCSEWETGIPIDLKRIRDKDEAYWDAYKGTPKAIISLTQGEKIWKNRFGNRTSIRFHKEDITKHKLEKQIMEKMQPEMVGFGFIPVYSQGIEAARNMVDFGELFLSLSFFVIVAGLLLTILIYSFNTQARARESGILSGLGLSKNLILKIRIWESLMVILTGGILGAFAGIIYNNVILIAINSIWQDVVRTDMIGIFIYPKTLVIGALTGVVLSLLTIYFVSRRSLKQSISGLVKKQIQTVVTAGHRKPFLNYLFPSIIVLLIAGMLIYSLTCSGSINPTLYLTSGALFMIISMVWLNNFMSAYRSSADVSLLNISSLAINNTRRQKARSLATVLLLAIGTFSVVITGANRKTFHGSEMHRNSGTGGFVHWMETTVPVLKDLNTDDGRKSYGLQDIPVLDSSYFVQMHLFDGDDASCLNLNQVEKPNILGLDPEEMHSRNAFSFARVHENIPANQVWLALNRKMGTNVIPAIADQTVIQWGLQKKVGDTLIYLDEFGKELKMVLIAGLGASIFQGNILISDSFFTKHFPSVSGSKIMLVDAPHQDARQIGEELRFYLQDYGIELTQTSKRLAEFYSVTNSYLSIFLALGGLGVLIGTIGLGIVLLRNLMERKSELALLLSVGFTKSQILKLVVIEFSYLLFLGIGIGAISAFLGIMPSLLSPSFSMPAGFILGIIGTIILSGFIWIYFPARIAMKASIIQTLKEE